MKIDHDDEADWWTTMLLALILGLSVGMVLA
jgi:hypothetical protein